MTEKQKDTNFTYSKVQIRLPDSELKAIMFRMNSHMDLHDLEESEMLNMTTKTDVVQEDCLTSTQTLAILTVNSVDILDAHKIATTFL